MEPLYADAQFVRVLRRNLTSIAFLGETYLYLSSTLKDEFERSPERWHAAAFKLLTPGVSV